MSKNPQFIAQKPAFIQQMLGNNNKNSIAEPDRERNDEDDMPQVVVLPGKPDYREIIAQTEVAKTKNTRGVFMGARALKKTSRKPSAGQSSNQSSTSTKDSLSKDKPSKLNNAKKSLLSFDDDE